MKTIIYKPFIYSLLFSTAFLLPVACDDWNEPETVDLDINSAKLLQKSGIRKNEVIELIYRGFI